MDYFLSEMQGKIANTLNHFDDALPFTELSKDCLTTHRAQYGNVYEKGALIGLCLDVVLRKASGGQMGLMDLMLAMMQKFGDEHPFRDRRLFSELRKLSYPEVGKFLKKYVDGKAPLPLKETFRSLGIEYTPPGKMQQFTYGNISLGYNADVNRVIVVSTANMNAFGKKMGYQDGDEIVSINGRNFDPENPMGLFYTEQMNFVEGESLVVEVVRKDASGKEQRLTLSAPVEKVEVQGTPSLRPMTSLTETQKAMQSEWMQGAKVVPARS
jgi:predicted metalloprotease with PDZ domain